MRTNNKHIPTNKMDKSPTLGIWVKKVMFRTDLPQENESIAHRHDHHIFIVVEAGKIEIEIDFENYILKKNAIVYIHPSQIHRILDLQHSSLSVLAISSEHIKREYFNILEQIFLSGKPIELSGEPLGMLLDSISMAEKIYSRKEDKLYSSLLQDHCNCFIGFYASQYQQNHHNQQDINRYQMVTKAFRQLLEKNYSTINKPRYFADALNISPSYLRECVRSATGISVSEHIHNRIILEAKRLMFHSDKTVKEIAVHLGYEDFSYFSRLFKKTSGFTAQEFRNKNILKK